MRLYRDVELRAREAGLEEIAAAIACCRARSRRRTRLLAAVSWMSSKRGLWRVARRLRPLVLAGSRP
jgi:hypothetical protein